MNRRANPDHETIDDLPYLPAWLDGPLDELLARRDSLHHALLIHGPAGIGKEACAWHLAGALLCEAEPPTNDAQDSQQSSQRSTQRSGHRACGQCEACHWFSQRNHPDFRAVLPEALDPDFVSEKKRKPSKEIRIGQVRALMRFLHVGAHRKGWRVIIITPADAMNHVTANGLLKTLEEPGSQTVLMLVTSHPNQLGLTIRSRCRSVSLRPPAREQALQWLVSNGNTDEQTAQAALSAAGSPLHALNLVEPAQATAHQAILEALAGLPDTCELGAADALDSHDPRIWADVLVRWVSDLTRVKAGSAPHYFPAQSVRMASLASRTTLEKLTKLQGQFGDLHARIEHPLNPRLICESTLLAYGRVFDQSGRAR